MVAIRSPGMIDWQKIDTWEVLVVDDEPDNLAVVTDVLEFYGMTVKAANNGEEGLETLQKFVPTIILLDLSMPKMDGWEMLKRVKAEPALQTVPVVALTAHAMSEDKKRVLAAGFDGYLKKPIEVSTLIEDLRAALEQDVVGSILPTDKQNAKESPGGLI